MPMARMAMPIRFTVWQFLIICAGIATIVLSLLGCATAGYTDDERTAIVMLDRLERMAP